MNFVGLDVGTTGAKALVVDERGAVLAEAYQSYPLLTPRENWCELNPDDLWNACKKVLAEVSALCRADFGALAVSSHAQAVVPVNAQGRALYSFISTVDTRTGEENAYWKNNFDQREMYLRTGLPFSPIYTVNKLLWLKKHQPEAFSQAKRFLCVQDFINWKLTGRAAIDCSLAGRGMLFNARQRRWDEQILDVIGIDASRLSEIVPSGELVGAPLPAVAEELGLRRDLRVLSGGHDQTCGCIGSGVLHPGQIMNATGTVEVMDAISPAFISDPRILELHYPCTPYIIGSNYLVMSINNSGGLLLQWYLNTFCRYEKSLAEARGSSPYDMVMNGSADAISDVYFLPHLNGAETPFQDPDSACSIVHLRGNTTQADITRGLLDSLAYEMRLNLEAFRSIGCEAREVRAIGGGARSAKLLQIKSDAIQLPIVSLDTKQAAALGAAMIAAVGAGAYADYEAAAKAMVRPARVYEPNPKLAAEYDERFEEYKMLYPSLKNVHQRISARVKQER